MKWKRYSHSEWDALFEIGELILLVIVYYTNGRSGDTLELCNQPAVRELEEKLNKY